MGLEKLNKFIGSPSGAAAMQFAQTGGGIISQYMANRANRKLQKQAQDYELQMWHLQNEYNSPSSQMQRLKDAGLNPNLMYGEGNVGNATSFPQAHSATVQPLLPSSVTNYMQMLDMYNNHLIKRKQLALIDEQIENKRADTAETNAKIPTILFDLAKKKEFKETEFKKLVQTISNLVAQEELAKVQKKSVKSDLDYKEQLRAYGANVNDNLWQRKLMEMLTKIKEELGITAEDHIPLQDIIPMIPPQ